jgi:type 1 glutamine amidotransferase
MSRIRVLLITGENNHDWRRSAPFCRDLLEGSGRFAVDLTETPSAALEDAVALAGCQLLFLDYNGPDWTDGAKASFLAAVTAGAGVLVLHAADNAFPGWVEYEKMVGLLWRDGTGHGAFHEFPVTIRDREHPGTRGLQDFRIWDELYHRLVHMHGVPYHVLATAYSSEDSGGTGRDEPVMVTTSYGRGRVFHMVLGHVWTGDPGGEYRGASMVTFENPGFQEALLRACEWAATGQVREP